MQEQRIPRTGPLRVQERQPEPPAGTPVNVPGSQHNLAPVTGTKRGAVEGIEQIARDGPFIYIAMRRDIDYDVTIKAIKEALGYEEPK